MHAKSIGVRSFSVIFYPIFVFVYQPTGVGSDYRSSCASQEEEADEQVW